MSIAIPTDSSGQESFQFDLNNAAPSSDTQSTTFIPARPHSASISSVHFAELVKPRGSMSSLRHETGFDTLNTLTPPRSVLKARSSSPIRSPGASPIGDHSAYFRSVPPRPPQDLTESYEAIRPSNVQRDSRNRRVRSEGGALTRAERSGSLIAHGKRASVVTGGYESSENESSTENHSNDDPPSKRLSIPRQSLLGVGNQPVLDEGRTRSKSLSTATTLDRPSSQLSRRDIHQDKRNHPRSGSYRSTAPSSRHPSQKSTLQPFPASQSAMLFGPSSESQDPRDKTNVRDAIGTKGKGKRKSLQEDDLTASLGFSNTASNVALTSDQINNLLADSDIASALRLISAGPLSTRNIPDGPSITPRSGSPPRHEPFVARAPPALLNDDSPIPTGRSRNISISSSINPPARSPWTSRHLAQEVDSVASRRRRASSRADVEGGHVPFTHHIPAMYVEEEAVSDQEDQSIAASEPPDATGPGVLLRETTQVEEPSKKKKGEGQSGRHRLSNFFHITRRRSSDNLSLEHRSSAGEKEKEEREREKNEQDAARRRLEQERRDAEMVQERRYRALTQVAAHPLAERVAYRVSSHLRAYYEQVYAGIDDPPKLDPLAVLRWKHRTDEQTAARLKWEQQTKLSRTTSPNGWLGQMHSSPASVGSSKPRKSMENASSLDQSTNGSEHVVAKWWRYTVEDVVAYNEAKGVVNYFLPPRPAMEQTNSHESDQQKSQVGLGGGHSISGSISKGSDMIKARITSASTASINSHAMSQESVVGVTGNTPVSRVASSETGKYSGRGEHKLTHRSHQSLGAMGPSSLSQAIKAPFGKIGSVTRKPRSSTAPRPLDRDPRMETLADDSAREHRNALPIKSQHLNITPAHNHRDHLNRFKFNGGSLSDEDRQDRERDFHLRKLFVKGQRPFSFDPRRPEIERIATNGNRVHDREAELRALETALAKESAFRERQAQALQQTKMEEEAKIRLRELEDEVYAERSQRLHVAKTQLQAVNSRLLDAEDNIQQYLIQIDHLATVAKVTAEVDIKFHRLDVLRSTSRLNGPSARHEESDILEPLRQSSTHESASGSEPRQPGSRSSSRHRSNTLQYPYSFGPKPWPRRTALAPDGTSTVNPIRRLELTLDHARNQHGALQSKRDETLVELRQMIKLVDSLIRQKDAVRSWTKAALEKTRSLRVTVDTLRAEVRGNSAARMGRLKDRFYNTLFRLLLTPLLKVSLSGVRGGRYLWSRRNREARENFRGIRSQSDEFHWLVWLLLGLAVMAFWLYWEGGKE